MDEKFMLGHTNLSKVAQCERDGGTGIVASIQRLTDVEEIRSYIAHIDFTLLKEKLTMSQDEGGQGWTIDLADKVEAKYKKWLFLKSKYENELIPPPNDIDIIWHSHLLDTHAYFRDTTTIFGKYLHHYPYFGIRGKADREKLKAAFENTKRLYLKEYGEEVTA